jgi:hypothetical protein
MKFKQAFLFIALAMSSSVIAQVQEQKIMELNIDGQLNDNMLSLFGDKGLMITTMVPGERKAKFDQLKFSLFDTELESMGERFARIDKKLSADGSDVNGMLKHHLFSRGKNLAIVTFDMETKKVISTSGIKPKKMGIFKVVALGPTLFLDAGIKKTHVLLALDWKSGRYNIVPYQIRGEKDKDLKLKNIARDDESGLLLASITGKMIKGIRPFYLLSISDKGKVKSQIKLENKEEKNVLDASVSAIKGKGNYIAVGTYSSKYKNKKPLALRIIGWTFFWPFRMNQLLFSPPNKRLLGAEGIYFAEVTKGNTKTFKRYNFLDFKHYADEFSDKGQDQLKKKRAKKKKQGKELSVNVNVFSHKVKITENEYLYVGEVYRPTYTTRTQTRYVNGQYTTVTITEFNGYEYSRALIACFDKQGELKWDETIELDLKKKPMNIREQVSVSDLLNNEFTFSYTSRENIVTTIIDIEGKVISEKASNMISVGDENSKLKHADMETRHWYDNNFVIYGYQNKKSKEKVKGEKKRKSIQFLGKVTL